MQQVFLNRSNNVQWSQVIVELVIFLLLPPIIGLPIVIFKAFQYRHNITLTHYMAFIVCIAVYFATINSTKAPSGDQVQYYAAYMNVPQMGFVKSLVYIYGLDVGEEAKSISGEFMNGVYNYIGYYITFGYYPLYAALLTFANYILVFLGLYKFSQTLKKPHIPIVCGVLILSFFYLYFQYLLQIQKQFLAQSIMMYVLGSYAVSGKMGIKEWIMTACAIFTHAATTLFLPFLIFKPLRRRLTKIGLLCLGILFSILIIIGPQLAGNVASSMGDSALLYGANRLAQSEINNDMEFGLVWSQVFVIALPMALIVLRKLWTERKTLEQSHAFILNVVLLLLLTVVAMFKQPLAQYRYFMMLFAFMPFVYPFICKNTQHRDTILKIIAGIMIIWFYYQFDKIVWHYAPEMDIIIKSPILLLFGNYYTI